jgi:hypothetical protein
MLNHYADDAFILVPRLSAALREATGDPGPGHRKLVDLANNAEIAPPMERYGPFWGCRVSRIPELVGVLGRRGLLASPGGEAAAPVTKAA